MKRQHPQAAKSNDPAGTRPPVVPAPPLPVDLAHLRAKLALLREMGVASYRGADGETVNLYASPTAAPDTRAADDAREDNDDRNERAAAERTYAAAGGIRPVGGRVLTPEMRRRLP